MNTETQQDAISEQEQAAHPAEQQQAAAAAAFMAKYPLTLASWFEPGKGLTLGLAPRGAQGPDAMIAKITYEDLAIAEHDLDACLKHVRSSIQSVIYSNAFGAGRASRDQELAAAQEQVPEMKDADTEVKVADSYDHLDDEIIDLSKVPADDPEIDQ